MATAEVSHIGENTTSLLKKCSELKEALRLEKSRLADTHRNVHLLNCLQDPVSRFV